MGFQRKVENFECEKCGVSVKGSGYTNHCPQCLWSKHVDIDPGDRAAACKGMMKPERIEGATARFRIVHKCTVCGHEKINDADAHDNPDALVALARRA